MPRVLHGMGSVARVLCSMFSMLRVLHGMDILPRVLCLMGTHCRQGVSNCTRREIASVLLYAVTLANTI